MKLCWDNIKNIRLSSRDNFKDIVKNRVYHYHEHCKQCNEEFLGEINNKFCCAKCSQLNSKGRIFSKEARKKISKANKGRVVTEETRKKMSESAKNKPPVTEETRKKLSKMRKGKKKSKEWKQKIRDGNLKRKGGYNKKNIPRYDIYAPQLEWCEKVRRNEQDPNILEVKCFKCDEWFVPKRNFVSCKIQLLKNKYKGNYNFYCSKECKDTCSVYGKRVNTIMREDAVRSGRLTWLELEREIQPELRQMVLERDEYKCIKCESTENIHCHHIYPVNIEPLLSADIDNCITLCINCHKEAHQKDGCKLHQLHMEEC